MSERNDGGPAFPVLEEYAQFNDSLGRYEDHYAPHGGMTLRDYFAAKAMPRVVPDHIYEPATVAEEAYALADAMLKAREQ